MTPELRYRINEDANLTRHAIKRVIEIHGLLSLSEEVKYFLYKKLINLASENLFKENH